MPYKLPWKPRSPLTSTATTVEEEVTALSGTATASVVVVAASKAAASPTMSCRGNRAKVDLKLNPELPAARGDTSRIRDGGGSDDDSSQSSCVSSEGEGAAGTPSPMVLAACPRCLMYVILAEDDTKCPKCKSAVLLDFLRGGGCGTGKNMTRKT